MIQVFNPNIPYLNWSPFQVSQYLKVSGIAKEAAEKVEEQQIDGNCLKDTTVDIMRSFDIKFGPSMAIHKLFQAVANK